MTVTARFTNEIHDQVAINLEDGDVFGNTTFNEKGAEVYIGMSMGNKEFDTLFPNASVKEDGSFDYGESTIPIADYINDTKPIVPISISDRQFFWALYKKGFVPQDQAIKAIKTGVTPEFIQSILNNIPEANDERIDAEMLIMGAKTIERYNPNTIKFAHAAGMTDNYIDRFFIFAFTL